MEGFLDKFDTQEANVIILTGGLREAVHAGQGDINHLFNVLRRMLLQAGDDALYAHFLPLRVAGLVESICIEHELHAGLKRNLTFSV